MLHLLQFKNKCSWQNNSGCPAPPWDALRMGGMGAWNGGAGFVFFGSFVVFIGKGTANLDVHRLSEDSILSGVDEQP